MNISSILLHNSLSTLLQTSAAAKELYLLYLHIDYEKSYKLKGSLLKKNTQDLINYDIPISDSMLQQLGLSYQGLELTKMEATFPFGQQTLSFKNCQLLDANLLLWSFNDQLSTKNISSQAFNPLIFFADCANFLHTNIDYLSIQEEAKFVEDYVRLISAYILAKSFSINDNQISCSMLEASKEKLNLVILNNYTIQIILSANFPRFKQLENELSYFFKSTFNAMHQKWQASIANKHNWNFKMQTLVTDTNVQYQTLINELKQHQNSIQQLVAKLPNDSKQEKITRPFEFYRGTTQWHIRFNATIVKLTTRSKTGLRYIHYLLQYPEKSFYPNQLEIIKINKGKASATLQLDNAISVELDILRHQTILENPKKIKKEIIALYKNLPDDIELEKKIYCLAEMIYLSDLLVKISASRENQERLRQLQDVLDTAILKLKLDYGDETLFVQQIISKAETISKPLEKNSQLRRLRQRVEKAIKNAIEAMEDKEAKKYFQATIKTGRVCQFSPNPKQPIDWLLFTQ